MLNSLIINEILADILIGLYILQYHYIFYTLY